jgi:hypothetical protein
MCFIMVLSISPNLEWLGVKRYNIEKKTNRSRWFFDPKTNKKIHIEYFTAPTLSSITNLYGSFQTR